MHHRVEYIMQKKEEIINMLMMSCMTSFFCCCWKIDRLQSSEKEKEKEKRDLLSKKCMPYIQRRSNKQYWMYRRCILYNANYDNQMSFVTPTCIHFIEGLSHHLYLRASVTRMQFDLRKLCEVLALNSFVDYSLGMVIKINGTRC